VAAVQRLVLWSELVLALLLRTKVGAPAAVITGGTAIVTTTAAAADGIASRVDIVVDRPVLGGRRPSTSQACLAVGASIGRFGAAMIAQANVVGAL